MSTQTTNVGRTQNCPNDKRCFPCYNKFLGGLYSLVVCWVMCWSILFNGEMFVTNLMVPSTRRCGCNNSTLSYPSLSCWGMKGEAKSKKYRWHEILCSSLSLYISDAIGTSLHYTCYCNNGSRRITTKVEVLLCISVRYTLLYGVFVQPRQYISTVERWAHRCVFVPASLYIGVLSTSSVFAVATIAVIQYY